ncbi:hypothetical protein Nepgr_033390 [Nepenthes gracilis]|uniref:Protein DA1-like domain-containing protein n=1 Tax=Nepenthes gracilis TaxID=150966 RepID=A0AAD3Y8Y5_NEPGR|nr:hypothetical protein Nepgr_033390 [Nepenthes gracilis]
MDEFWKLELLIDAIDQTILDWVMVLVCIFLAMVHNCIIHIIHIEEFNNGLYALSFITDYKKDKEGMLSVPSNHLISLDLKAARMTAGVSNRKSSGWQLLLATGVSNRKSFGFYSGSFSDTRTKRKPDIKKAKQLLPFFLKNLVVLAIFAFGYLLDSETNAYSSSTFPSSKGFHTQIEEGIRQLLAFLWLESTLISGSGSSAASTSFSISRLRKRGMRSPFKMKLGKFFKNQIESDISLGYGFRAAS